MAQRKAKIKIENTHSTFRALYLMGFMFAVAMALPLYVNSSFLGQFVSDQKVGLIYTASSVVTFFLLAFMPKILSILGNYRTTLYIALAEFLLLLGLAFFKSFWLIAGIYIIYAALVSVLYLNFDVFLERFSQESETGRIRAFFLTIANLAIFISPLIAGFILGEGDYWKVYTLSAAFMVFMTFFLVIYFKSFQDSKYDRKPYSNLFFQVFQNPKLSRVFFAGFLLRFFFAWMVIYSPLYLHEHVGFAWDELGTIFTLMLLPYILFELPAGKLADTKWGEKEIMTAGFIITGISTVAIIFFSQPVFWIWVVVLFLTRVGASLIEITTESYFFKQVDSSDAELIGFFRDARPLAYIIAPVLASFFLWFLDFKYLFLILGVVMLTGVFASLTLEDTR